MSDDYFRQLRAATVLIQELQQRQMAAGGEPLRAKVVEWLHGELSGLVKPHAVGMDENTLAWYRRGINDE